MTATWHWCSIWCGFLACSRLKTCIIQLQVRFCLQMNALKMEDEKLHFCHIIYSMNFRKKCQNCNKKYSEGLFRLCSHFLNARFCQGDFNLNDQLLFRWPDIDNDPLLAIVQNKLEISTDEIDKCLKIDISTASDRLKRLGFKKSSPFCQIKKVPFYIRTQDHML